MMRCLIVDDDEFSRSVIEDLVKEEQLLSKDGFVALDAARR